MFDARDRQTMAERGISEEDVLRQIALFKKGPPVLTCDRPCRPGDGIIIIPESQVMALAQTYARQAPERKITKFVPASGAASRMFKSLEAWAAEPTPSGPDFEDVQRFAQELKRFAFYERLRDHLAEQGRDVDRLVSAARYAEVIAPLRDEDGLNFVNLPKGLLPFHRRGDRACTPAEEHLIEAAQYGRGKDGVCRVHFTVAEEHRAQFEALCAELAAHYASHFQCRYDVSFSVQDPRTDTIAVNPDNTPFRGPDGSLEFRPGGHGALIRNLNDLDADLIFIKNIDNCVPDRLKPPTVVWKKVLAGLLIQKQQACFSLVARLCQHRLDPSAVEEARIFATGSLNLQLDKGMARWPVEEQRDTLLRLLNRPLRVCGMVRNQGEPGGGPFWVRARDGRISRQIVESAQVDRSDAHQNEVWQQATHFNPVDLVCGVRDFRGEKFDLQRHVDEDAVFIAEKSKDGKPLKALEYPGLWNGAMSDWITLFVEVPMMTFNPVKTVLDLLRPQHQNGNT